MATNRPQDDYQKQGVRLPRALHEALHEAAHESGRSYNAELIARLEESLQGGGGSDVVLDQAVQIWELRQSIADAYAAAILALRVFDGEEFLLEDSVKALQTVVTKNSRQAGEVLNRLLTESMADVNEAKAAALRNLISAVSNDTLAPAPSNDAPAVKSRMKPHASRMKEQRAAEAAEAARLKEKELRAEAARLTLDALSPEPRKKR